MTIRGSSDLRRPVRWICAVRRSRSPEGGSDKRARPSVRFRRRERVDRTEVHARQRRVGPVLHGRADGRRRRLVRLRQRRRPRRVPRTGRAARRRRGRGRRAAAGCSATILPSPTENGRCASRMSPRRRRGLSRLRHGRGGRRLRQRRRLDLFVTGFGAALLHNNGNGTFTDVTAQAGVGDALWTTSAAFLDYDRDGQLDLFVANTWTSPFSRTRSATTRSARATTAAPAPTGRSPTGCITTKAAAASWTSPRRRASARLTAPDSASRPGTTTATAGPTSTSPTTRRPTSCGSTGTTAPSSTKGSSPAPRSTPPATPRAAWASPRATSTSTATKTSSSPTSSAKPSRCTSTTGRPTSRTRGPARASRRRPLPSRASRRTGSTTTTTGCSISFVANGAVNVIEAQRGQPRPFRMKNQLFRNGGDGRFTETTAAGGPAFASPGIGRGAAFGDIDNDGDVDIVATNNGGPSLLLLNQSVEAGGRITGWRSRLRQPAGNRFAFGAWVGVERAGPADTLAACADRRQLPLGQRRAAPFRAGRLSGHCRRRRPVARRPARAADRCRRRFIHHPAPIANAPASALIGSFRRAFKLRT